MNSCISADWVNAVGAIVNAIATVATVVLACSVARRQTRVEQAQRIEQDRTTANMLRGMLQTHLKAKSKEDDAPIEKVDPFDRLTEMRGLAQQLTSKRTSHIRKQILEVLRPSGDQPDITVGQRKQIKELLDAFLRS